MQAVLCGEELIRRVSDTPLGEVSILDNPITLPPNMNYERLRLLRLLTQGLLERGATAMYKPWRPNQPEIIISRPNSILSTNTPDWIKSLVQNIGTPTVFLQLKTYFCDNANLSKYGMGLYLRGNANKLLGSMQLRFASIRFREHRRHLEIKSTQVFKAHRRNRQRKIRKDLTLEDKRFGAMNCKELTNINMIADCFGIQPANVVHSPCYKEMKRVLLQMEIESKKSDVLLKETLGLPIWILMPEDHAYVLFGLYCCY